MPSRLADKWVLITGASSGFGAAAARAFGAEGARLLLGARRLDRLEAVAAAARKAGSPAALFHALDVSQTKSVNGFIEWAKEQTSRNSEPASRSPQLDVLINTADGRGRGRDAGLGGQPPRAREHRRAAHQMHRPGRDPQGEPADGEVGGAEELSYFSGISITSPSRSQRSLRGS